MKYEGFSVNLFKNGAWVGYLCEDKKENAIAAAKTMFSSKEYSAVNVENSAGKVVFVAK